MSSSCRNPIALGALVLFVGCQIGTSTMVGDEAVSLRPGDGLLRDPELQAIVDLQVERDALGLAEMLFTRDATLRARAAFALGSVQEPTTLPILVSRLEIDEDAAVRRDPAFCAAAAELSRN
ncbi:MAG TPA: HEAT repeat domain-containing protein [Gemmatimonadetes bacterium]|nr:HEAT repeat domain-containing protein [Gemmatimonadota bacterium]